jgi:DNA polymerase III epsilon subunit-like protein
LGTDLLKPVRYAWCDLETTDVEDPLCLSPIQIFVKVEEPDGSVDSLNLFVQPLAGDIMSQGATDAHGFTMEDTKDFMDPRFAVVRLKRFLRGKVNRYDPTDKLLFSGYNAFFDYKVLRVWFERQNVEFFGAFFSWPPYDVMSYAGKKLAPIRHHFPDFSLETVARFLGYQITDDRLHDAEYDIELTQYVSNVIERESHDLYALVRRGDRIIKEFAEERKRANL